MLVALPAPVQVYQVRSNNDYVVAEYYVLIVPLSVTLWCSGAGSLQEPLIEVVHNNTVNSESILHAFLPVQSFSRQGHR
jgi:hypothetical protein